MQKKLKQIEIYNMLHFIKDTKVSQSYKTILNLLRCIKMSVNTILTLLAVFW